MRIDISMTTSENFDSIPHLPSLPPRNESLSQNVYLASKLRQIKNKLDETTSYPLMSSNKLPPPLPPPPPPPPPPPSSGSALAQVPNATTHFHSHANKQPHFQFEMANHPTSFDHLFDQFKHDLANHVGATTETAPSNNDYRAVSLASCQFSDNVSRQSSIRSLVNNGSKTTKTSSAAGKTKTSLGILNKHEYELIADWDVYNRTTNNR